MMDMLVVFVLQYVCAK